MRRLNFFFDYVSPYSYVAWTQLPAIAKKHDIVVEPMPTLFSGLLNAHGTVGPAEIPAKRAYLFKDVNRKAVALGLPLLALPPTHPFNPLLALRVSGLPMPEAERARLITALYAEAWGTGRGVESREIVIAAIRQAGLDGEALVRLAEAGEAKARLRDATSAAVAAGVFGVPTMRIENELFWGLDSLPALEVFLEGRDPLPAGFETRIQALGASAQRRH